MDPRLVSHGASFWGWTEEETDALLSGSTEESSIHTLQQDNQGSQEVHQTQSLLSHSLTTSDLIGLTTSSSLSKLSHSTAKDPQYLVFDAKSRNLKRNLNTSKKDFKNFMSSNPAKILSCSKANVAENNKKDKEEEEEERILSLQDKELKDLLESSNLIEQYASEELVGKSRRYYQMQKLVELGMKPLNKQPVEQKTKMNILKREKKEMLKAKALAKSIGLHSSHKSDDQVRFLAERYSNKKKASSSIVSFAALRKPKSVFPRHKSKHDRGLHGSIGRFKNGLLTVRHQDIKRIEKMADKQEKKANSAKKSSKNRS